MIGDQKDSSQAKQNVTPEKSNQQSLFETFSEWFKGLLKKPEDLPVVPMMTYDAAMKYFITERPSDPRIQKGGILRQKHPKGYLLALMFLDNNEEFVLRPDQKPYGRQLIAKELDKELMDTFSDKNLILVE